MIPLKSGIQILELVPSIPSFQVEMTPVEIIDLTVRENFGMMPDENIKDVYGDYFITYLN